MYKKQVRLFKWGYMISDNENETDNLDTTLIDLGLDIDINIFVAEHTQTIRRQFADELFECVWPFCGIGA